jgi:hypothetical protein
MHGANTGAWSNSSFVFSFQVFAEGKLIQIMKLYDVESPSDIPPPVDGVGSRRQQITP